MKEWLRNILEVESREKYSILYLLVFAVSLSAFVSLHFIQTASGFITTTLTGETWYTMLLYTGGFTFLLLWGYQKLINYLSQTTLTSIYLSVLFIGIISIDLKFVPLNNDVLLGYFYSWSFLNLLLLREIYNRLFNASQIIRLVKFQHLGSALGIGVIGLIVFNAGLNNIIALKYCLMLFSIVSFIALVKKNKVLLESDSNSVAVNYNNSLKKVVANSYYAKLTLVLTLVFVIVFLVQKNLFHFFVQEPEYKEGIVEFLGKTMMLYGIAASLVSLFLLKVIFSKLEFRGSALLYAVTTAVFVVIASIILLNTSNLGDYYMYFMVIAIYYGISEMLFHFQSLPVLELYLNPVRLDLKRDVKIKLLAVAFLLSTLLIFGVDKLLKSVNISGGFIQDQLILLGFSLLAVVFILVFHKAYNSLLKNSMQEGTLKASKVKFEIPLQEEINSYLEKDHKRVNPALLNLLEKVAPIDFQNSLGRYTNTKDDLTQCLVSNKIREWKLDNTIEGLKEIVDNKYFYLNPNKFNINFSYAEMLQHKERIQKEEYVPQLTFSTIINEKVEGAMLLKLLQEKDKIDPLVRLLKEQDEEIVYHALLSATGVNNKDVWNAMLPYLSYPSLGYYTVKAFSKMNDEVLPTLESHFELSGQTELCQLNILRVYGNIGGEKAANLLLKRVNNNNLNIANVALTQMSKTGYSFQGSVSPAFFAELQTRSEIILRYMQAFEIVKDTVSTLLLESIKKQIETHYTYIFRILALSYEPEVIIGVRNNLSSGNRNRGEQAIELLSVLLPSSLSYFLIPILRLEEYSSKLVQMEGFYPQKQKSVDKILVDLVILDVKYIDQWTKALALTELKKFQSKGIYEVYKANLVNPNSFIRECAFDGILANKSYIENINEVVGRISKFYGEDFQNRLESQEINNKLQSKITLIEALKKQKCFDKLSGEELVVLSEYSKIESGENKAQFKCSFEQLPLILLLEGELEIWANNEKVKTLYPGQVLSSFEALFNINLTIKSTDSKSKWIQTDYNFIKEEGVNNMFLISALFDHYKSAHNKFNVRLVEFQKFVSTERFMKYPTIDKTNVEVPELATF